MHPGGPYCCLLREGCGDLKRPKGFRYIWCSDSPPRDRRTMSPLQTGGGIVSWMRRHLVYVLEDKEEFSGQEDTGAEGGTTF